MSRLKKYESFQSKYDFSSLTYPVPLNDIDMFCRRNNCSINVYGVSGSRDNDYKVNIEDDEIDIEDDEIDIDDDIEDDQEVYETSDDDMDIEDDIKNNEQEKEGMVYPLEVAKVIIKKRHANLLLTEKNDQHHYTTIKDFSRLVRSQISRNKCQHFYCYSCMHGFIDKELLKIHPVRLAMFNEQTRQLTILFSSLQTFISS